MGTGISHSLISQPERRKFKLLEISKPKNQGATGIVYGRVLGARQQIWGPRDPGTLLISTAATDTLLD